MSPILICDKDVARLIGMSSSWVRVERWKRKNRKDHALTVDAVMIGGSSPRYKLADIEAWINSLDSGDSDAR